MVVKCLNALPDASYYVRLDNLFISYGLLVELRSHGWAATGIVRTNSGMVQSLMELKVHESTQDIFAWGTLFKGVSNDNLLMQFAWKDNHSQDRSLCGHMYGVDEG